MHNPVHTQSIRKDLIKRIQRLSHPLEPQPARFQPFGEQLTNMRAVLFDVYGTLFISGAGEIGVTAAPDDPKAMREAFDAAGLELAPGAETEALRLFRRAIHESHELSRIRGLDFPEVDIRRVWEMTLMHLEEQGVLAGGYHLEAILILALEYECRVNPVWPMPDIGDVLKALRYMDYRLGIVSNAQFYTPLLFTALLGHSLDELGFDPAFCAWSYERLEAKPSTVLFEGVVRAFERADIAPGQVVYVGNDMLNDIRSAAAVGFRTVLFAGDARSLRLREEDDRCKGLRPDAAITSLSQLPGLLES